MVYGLVGGLVYGLVGALLYGLVQDWGENGVRTLVEFCIGALIGGLLVGLSLGLLVGLNIGVVSSLVKYIRTKHDSFIQIDRPYQRFLASIRLLHFSILEHWLLRYQFYKKGLLPLQLVRFLNAMVEIHLIESDGATWRFRHRILQEYFAQEWEEKYKTNPKNNELLIV